MLWEKVWLEISSARRLFAYRSIPDPEGSKAWMVEKPKCLSEGLELILWDVVQLDWLRFDLRWARYRSWLCFALDDGSLVDRGGFAASFFR